MKNLIFLIYLSILFSAYYTVGDTVNSTEHLNYPIEICHGINENENSTIFNLEDNLGKITIIGLEIPW